MEVGSIDELHKILKSNKFDFVNCQVLTSKTPRECEKNEECILGVDEAGRGPVLGPMVYAVSYITKERMTELNLMGCADSKTLSEKQREEIFSIICASDDYMGWSVDVISPNVISNRMLNRWSHSLNEIAEESTVKLIKSVLQKGINITQVYVDTVGPADKYQEKLSQIFPNQKITVSKKADSIYPIVSAASICAKVTRDSVIRNWKCLEHVPLDTAELGSGYPNDPETQMFLKNKVDPIFGFPNLVRFSWSTAAAALAHCPIVELDIDDENDKSKRKKDKSKKNKSSEDTQNITSFFNLTGNKHLMKHKFFRDRRMENITSF